MANAINPDDINPRTRVVGPITPISNADSEPTHFSDFAYGGMRTVGSETERFAIPLARRVEGMIVFQADTNLYYRLNENISNNATGWELFDPGSSIASSFTASFNATDDWTLVTGTTADYTIDFTHGLTSLQIEYIIYDENNNFVFACVSLESNERLRISINAPVTRFAGRITINREG